MKGIVNAVAGIAKGFGSALKGGVEYNARMEQYTTMLGDQAKAQQLVNDLKAEAARASRTFATLKSFPCARQVEWRLSNAMK